MLYEELNNEKQSVWLNFIWRARKKSWREPNAFLSLCIRSAYFQQIEEDVQKHAKAVTELKATISSFKTKDLTELIKFHKHVESILENLTDETQVNIAEKVCYFHYSSMSACPVLSISISLWPVFLRIAGACKIWRFSSEETGSIKDCSCPRLEVEWSSLWTAKLEDTASTRPTSWQGRMLLQQGNFASVLNSL